jgi:hypothetical protein
LRWWIDFYRLDCIPTEEVGGKFGIFIDLGAGQEFVELPVEATFQSPRDAYLYILGFVIGQKAKLIRSALSGCDRSSGETLAKMILEQSESHEKRILKKLADLDELLNPMVE